MGREVVVVCGNQRLLRLHARGAVMSTEQLTLERRKIGEFMEPSKKESFHENLRFRFVRGFAVCSAVISLLFLISCPSAFAGGRHGFSIKVFTSPDDQFWTNSIIIEGVHEVMLVDAQLTKTSAEKVALHENS